MDLIFDVLAHPKEMPSIPELLYMNKFVAEDEVLAQLSLLVEYGILERVTAPTDGESNVDPALPVTFYTLTVDGWAAVEHFDDQFNDVIRSRLQTTYEQVPHPSHITRCQSAPRPSIAPPEEDA